MTPRDASAAFGRPWFELSGSVPFRCGSWEKIVKAVILDRDGTLIREKEYLHDPQGVELVPGVPEGLALLRRHGYSLIVATNQAGVGRGLYSLEDMHAVNARLQALLAGQGTRLDAVYYCPHAPEEQCRCRKPAPGMLERAVCERGISLESSFVIGDKESDVLFGRNAGMRAILVRSGYGAETERQGTRATYVADTLYDAARWITDNAP
jgi:D-glycero-D-manno-heptose 1,7-bisphosphate phosphatase